MAKLVVFLPLWNKGEADPEVGLAGTLYCKQGAGKAPCPPGPLLGCVEGLGTQQGPCSSCSIPPAELHAPEPSLLV